MVVKSKLLIIGLDCAAPSLFFKRHLDNIPTLCKFQASGRRGQLRSSDPPITIPAWMCMATGRTPGQLGIYGFRHRKKKTYDDLWIASSLSVKEKTAWETLSDNGLRSIIVGIPPTFPVKPFNGNMVTGFITPGVDNQFTHPESLKNELLDKFGHYTFDVPFRIEDKKGLFDNLMKMTRERHEVIKHLMKNKEWDLFWFVEIGLDRMHHAYWKYFDENHKDFVEGNEFQDCIEKYEKLLDNNVKELLEIIPDDTRVLVVSDHGAQPMAGCVCVNEWLFKEGYLTLNKYPEKQTSPTKLDINWTKTKAWGWGGYYARIFLNIKGREPDGAIELHNVINEVKILREKIEALKGPDGSPLGSKTFNSRELYPDGFIGDHPDLYVYFGDLKWRSAGTVGHDKLFLEENDTGPDDAVHAKNGIYIEFKKEDYLAMKEKPDSKINKQLNEKEIDQFSIYDIYPTILKHFGLEIPDGLRGKPLV
ncbi:MAG: alkaline phosphatase family protein [Candidatus Hodarchaeota archaeon]